MQRLRHIVHWGAGIALTIRLFRFFWMHRWDVYVWSVGSLSHCLFAQILPWALRPMFPGHSTVAVRLLSPWTIVGSLLAYVTYRLREPEKLPKLSRFRS